MYKSIQFRCPEMLVRKTGPNSKRTVELPTPVTVWLDDGSSLEGHVTFPECNINRVHPMMWLVAEAYAPGMLVDGTPVSARLAPEQVVGPRARRVACTIIINDIVQVHGMWPGVWSYPVGGGDWMVRPVVAEFDLTQTLASPFHE